MQKLYQTFVALAAQLQGVHENVKVSSENVLNGPYLIFSKFYYDVYYVYIYIYIYMYGCDPGLRNQS